MFGFRVTSLKGSFCIQLVCLSNLAYLSCFGAFSHVWRLHQYPHSFLARRSWVPYPHFRDILPGHEESSIFGLNLMCRIFLVSPGISNLPSNASHCVYWFFLFFTRPRGQQLVFVFNGVTPAPYVNWYTVGIHYIN